MRTTDFKDIGSFYRNDKGIVTFITTAEEHILRSNLDFIAQNNFEILEEDINSIFIEADATMIELIQVIRGLHHSSIPTFVGFYEFPNLLNLDFIESKQHTGDAFPASQVCKALSLKRENFIPFKTEQRLILTDYATKMPSSKEEILVFPNVIRDWKTVYPKSFDSWVKLLLKAKEFKTTNKEFLLFKSLFDVK